MSYCVQLSGKLHPYKKTVRQSEFDQHFWFFTAQKGFLKPTYCFSLLQFKLNICMQVHVHVNTHTQTHTHTCTYAYIFIEINVDKITISIRHDDPITSSSILANCPYRSKIFDLDDMWFTRILLRRYFVECLSS